MSTSKATKTLVCNKFRLQTCRLPIQLAWSTKCSCRTLVGLYNASVCLNNVMYQSNRRFNIPTTPRHLTPLSSLGVGNLITYTNGVGNLNSNLDFMLHVPARERGLTNRGAGQHAVRNGEFKYFKRKNCPFVTTWIKSKGLQRLFSVF